MFISNSSDSLGVVVSLSQWSGQTTETNLRKLTVVIPIIQLQNILKVHLKRSKFLTANISMDAVDAFCRYTWYTSLLGAKFFQEKVGLDKFFRQNF